MLPNHLARLAVLGLVLTLAPAALAETEPACPDGTTPTPEGCSQQAWVDDCPPDMMCAADAPAEEPAQGPADQPDQPAQTPGDGPAADPKGNATDAPTFGDCGGEVCAYGDETCIECSGPVDGSGSCMDGTATDCRDDVLYLGPERGPQDGSCENCRDLSEAGAKQAPGVAAAALLALAAVLVAFLRK